MRSGSPAYSVSAAAIPAPGSARNAWTSAPIAAGSTRVSSASSHANSAHVVSAYANAALTPPV